jgi:hypothetical protein
MQSISMLRHSGHPFAISAEHDVSGAHLLLVNTIIFDSAIAVSMSASFGRSLHTTIASQRVQLLKFRLIKYIASVSAPEKMSLKQVVYLKHLQGSLLEL